MPIHPAQKKWLDKILNSSEFIHSKIDQAYLTYLIEASSQGRELKETTIAIEFFGKNANFNPAEDTIVRSHTYTLRKKLETYYLLEGKNDKYRFRIPKGHYRVEFIPASKAFYAPYWIFQIVFKKYAGFTIAVLFGLCVILGIRVHSLHQRLQKYKIIEQNDPIWKDYLQSSLPILIVVGDHFFFDEQSEKYKGTIAIRHPKVNSAEDFHALFPNLILEPSTEPYFPYHAIWSLPPILSILFSANKNFTLRKSSDITPQMLDEYNIIFLGSIKTLYKLKHTLLKSHFRYQIAPHKVIYCPPNTDSVQCYETKLHSPGPNEDLVLALKLPGPKHNSIFLIASYHSLGAPSIAHYFISPELRKGLEQKFQEKFHTIPPYFEVLFRVTGIDKTPYSTEILVFNKLSEN